MRGILHETLLVSHNYLFRLSLNLASDPLEYYLLVHTSERADPHYHCHPMPHEPGIPPETTLLVPETTQHIHETSFHQPQITT